MTLEYRLASEQPGEPSRTRRVPARMSGSGRTLTFRIPARLSRNERFHEPTLVVTDGSANGPGRYTVTAG